MTPVTIDHITPNEMNAILGVASCRAEPIIPEGWTVPNGYLLHGPRGNRKTVFVNHNGQVPRFDIELWTAGIAYGDKKIADRLARKVGAGNV